MYFYEHKTVDTFQYWKDNAALVAVVFLDQKIETDVLLYYIGILGVTSYHYLHCLHTDYCFGCCDNNNKDGDNSLCVNNIISCYCCILTLGGLPV